MIFMVIVEVGLRSLHYVLQRKGKRPNASEGLDRSGKSLSCRRNKSDNKTKFIFSRLNALLLNCDNYREDSRWNYLMETRDLNQRRIKLEHLSTQRYDRWFSLETVLWHE